LRLWHALTCVCSWTWARHWGLSNETSYGVAQMVEAAKRLGVPPPISIQNDFAPVFRCAGASGVWVCVCACVRVCAACTCVCTARFGCGGRAEGGDLVSCPRETPLWVEAPLPDSLHLHPLMFQLCNPYRCFEEELAETCAPGAYDLG
jgi:hypothetical protein